MHAVNNWISETELCDIHFGIERHTFFFGLSNCPGALSHTHTRARDHTHTTSPELNNKWHKLCTREIVCTIYNYKMVSFLTRGWLFFLPSFFSKYYVLYSLLVLYLRELFHNAGASCFSLCLCTCPRFSVIWYWVHLSVGNFWSEIFSSVPLRS